MVKNNKQETHGSSKEPIIVAVGDVVISRQNPAAVFTKTIRELKSGTFSCCNLEVPLSNKGLPQYGKFETLHAAPEMIDGYVEGGFKVVSLANNHFMDYGSEALLDTLDVIDSRGILRAGAGKNWAEAWKPAFFEAGGLQFAFMSFATEAFPGYGAHGQKPGIAMIRRDPLYGPSCVNPDDVLTLKEHIRKAKKESDFVMVAFHWGLSQSRALTKSQLTLGRAAVDAGAGLIIGHHPHVLQGVEVYKNSLILYSLGNFVFDLMPEFLSPATRDTVLVKIRLSGSKIKDALFLPCWINNAGEPEFVDDTHDKNGEILTLLQKLSAARKTNISIQRGRGIVEM